MTLTLEDCDIAGGGTTPSRRNEASVDGAAASEWVTAPAGSHGIPPSAIEAVLEQGAATPCLTSLIVMRHGLLIGDRYYRGASASDLLPVRSVTKSIASLLVGLAIERGTIHSVQEPLSRLLPEDLAHDRAAPTCLDGGRAVPTMPPLRYLRSPTCC